MAPSAPPHLTTVMTDQHGVWLASDLASGTGPRPLDLLHQPELLMGAARPQLRVRLGHPRESHQGIVCPEESPRWWRGMIFTTALPGTGFRYPPS